MYKGATMADEPALQYTKARVHTAQYDGFISVLTWSSVAVIILLVLLAAFVV